MVTNQNKRHHHQPPYLTDVTNHDERHGLWTRCWLCWYRGRARSPAAAPLCHRAKALRRRGAPEARGDSCASAPPARGLSSSRLTNEEAEHRLSPQAAQDLRLQAQRALILDRQKEKSCCFTETTRKHIDGR